MATPTTEEIATIKGFMQPDLASNARVNTWITAASFRVGKSYFGDSWAYAMALMASHIGALESRGADGASGAIASVREGDISVSYSTSGSSDSSDLGSTSFGQQFESLKKQYSARPGVSGSSRLFCGVI